MNSIFSQIILCILIVAYSHGESFWGVTMTCYSDFTIKTFGKENHTYKEPHKIILNLNSIEKIDFLKNNKLLATAYTKGTVTFHKKEANTVVYNSDNATWNIKHSPPSNLNEEKAECLLR